MIGKYKVVVSNNKLHYEFLIKRNITIIQGDSATGKTTLIGMLRQHMNLGISSGVDVVCDIPCRILEGTDWKTILSNITGNIIFIDEENAFISSKEFARIAQESDNYFVIITRENLYNLPYSVEEIYGLHVSGKYQNTKKIYQEMYRMYSRVNELPIEPKKILVEDSNAGYEFYDDVCKERRMSCISAGGNSNIFPMLLEMKEDICVVADGAAIGAYMNSLSKVVNDRGNVSLYLPESFEWIILQSGLFEDKEIKDIMDNPESYIDSKEYFSWERYFTHLLISKTEGSYLQYRKAKLNPAYTKEKVKDKILASIKGISFKEQ